MAEIDVFRIIKCHIFHWALVRLPFIMFGHLLSKWCRLISSELRA